MSTVEDNRIYREPPTMEGLPVVVETREIGSPMLPADPMTMISQAVNRGASVEVLNGLFDLQKRWESDNARKEYENAIANARAEIKPITKNRKGTYGQYADMAGIASVIDPIIALHGLSYRFRSKAEDSKVVVTCIISHRGGHSEENSVPGPVDTSGSKNAIQSIGSTLTYLQRYTLTMALGLSFEDNPDDDDGRQSPRRPPPAPRVPSRPIPQKTTEMNDAIPDHDAETGEIVEEEDQELSKQLIYYDKMLADAAESGDLKKLQSTWEIDIPRNIKPALESAKERRHKPRCKEVAASHQ